MGWKNMSYWLRGGIIGAGISFILICPLIYLIMIFSIPTGPNWELLIPLLFLYLSFFFLIGILIGFIYGKIKNRGKNDK